MSDVEVLSPTTPNRPDEAEIDQQEELEAGEEETNQDEQVQEDEEEQQDEKRPIEDDRTEDQVPDITGTENADMMTTSMEGIDELPAAEDEAESGDMLDISPQMEEETVEEEISQEPEEVPEGQAEDTVIETEVMGQENEVVQEIMQDTTAVEEPVEAEHEAETTEEPKEFELQAPPVPKRPRTPSNLDYPVPAEDEETGADEGLTEEIAPIGDKPEETPVTPAQKTPTTAAGSMPGTPKSAQAPGTPLSAATPRTPAQNGEVKTPVTSSSRKSSTASKKAFEFEEPGTPKTPKSAILDISPATPPKTPTSARTPKTPVKSPMASEQAKTPVSSTPKSNQAFDFEEPPPATPKTPKSATPAATPKTPLSAKRMEPAAQQVEEAQPETEAVATVAEETVEQPTENEDTQQQDEQPEERVEVVEEELKRVEAPICGTEPEVTNYNKMEDTEVPRKVSYQDTERVASPPCPPRTERSPSPVRQKAPRETHTTTHYDQDSFRQTAPPPRFPVNNASYSSYTPVDKPAYSLLSPWVQNATNKYRTEHTITPSYHAPSLYMTHFDDIVSTGAFSNSLYSTNRLLERSRSRTRERQRAMRSARSASNYSRYAPAYTTPLRTREYSTPPSSALNKHPSRSSSFISFIDYSGSKQYEMARSRSRSAFDSLYSGSRSNIEPYYEGGRLSRVDSFVHDMDRRYESGLPSTYAKYRSSSRSNIPQSRDGYAVLSSSSYDAPRSYYGAGVRGMYEARISDLERSLSRERMARDKDGLYGAIRQPSSHTLSRLYSGFTRNWVGV